MYSTKSFDVIADHYSLLSLKKKKKTEKKLFEVSCYLKVSVGINTLTISVCYHVCHHVRHHVCDQGVLHVHNCVCFVIVLPLNFQSGFPLPKNGNFQFSNVVVP